MLGTTTKLSMPFQVLKEMLFFGLGPTLTEHQEIQKQDLKNIKNVQGCRNGMPKSMQTSEGKFFRVGPGDEAKAETGTYMYP